MGLLKNVDMLPRQGNLHGKDWSLERETQHAQALAAGVHKALGAGLLTPGGLVAGVGHSVSLPAGEILFVAGLVYQLDAPLVCNNAQAGATNTLWCTLIRTAANQAGFANLDTFAPTLTATQDGNPPASPPAGAGPYFAVGTMVVDGGGAITSLTDLPTLAVPGGSALGQPDVIAAGTKRIIPAGYTEIAESITTDGDLIINGTLTLL